jgi:hypothetical protein
MENTNNSGFFSRLKHFQIQKNNLIEGIYLSGEDSPYFKYFLAKEEENKQNLVMMYQLIYQRNIFIASVIFFSYNLVKSILWKRGYFAYFFYHTRMMSVLLYFMSMNLMNKNFLANLKSNEILGYYKKQKRLIEVEESIKVKFMKSKLLNQKLNI